jgi:hypothetical protein
VAVNALSGSVGFFAISATPGAPKDFRDCDQPFPKLRRLSATQIQRGSLIDRKIAAYC